MHKFLSAIFVYLFLSLSVQADDFNDAVAAYEKGDYRSAFNLLKPLAEQGDANAQYNLGYLYESGEGVEEDDKKAVKWSRLAAEQGDAWGHNNLGDMYQFGKGVPKDAVLAYMWWNLAAANSTDTGASIYRDSISKKMTSSQIEEAQKLSRECLKKEYKNCY